VKEYAVSLRTTTAGWVSGWGSIGGTRRRFNGFNITVWKNNNWIERPDAAVIQESV